LVNDSDSSLRTSTIIKVMAFPGGVDIEFTSRTDNFINGVRSVRGELKSLDRDARTLDLSSRSEAGARSLQTFSSSAQRASVDVKGLTLSMVGLGTTMIGIFAASSRLDFAQNRLQKTQVAVKRINDQIASTQKNLNRLIDQGKTNTEDYRVQLGRLETAFADQKTKIEDVKLAQTALNDTQLLFATTIVNTAINSIFLMRSAFSGLSIAQIKAAITSRLFGGAVASTAAPIAFAKTGIMGLTLQTKIFGVALKTAILPLIAITAGFAAWEGIIAPFIREQTDVNLSILDFTDNMLAGKVAVEGINQELLRFQDAAGEAGEATGEVNSEIEKLFSLVGKPSNNPLVEFWRRARLEQLIPTLSMLKEINNEQSKAVLLSGTIPSGNGNALISGGGGIGGVGTALGTQNPTTTFKIQQAQQEVLQHSLANATPTTQRELVKAVEAGIKTSKGTLSRTEQTVKRLGLHLGIFTAGEFESKGFTGFDAKGGIFSGFGGATVTGTNTLTPERLSNLFRLAAVDPILAGRLGLQAIGAANQNFITGQQIAQGFTFGESVFDAFDNSARSIRRRIKNARLGADDLFRGSTGAGGGLLATDFADQFTAINTRSRNLRDLDPFRNIAMRLFAQTQGNQAFFGTRREQGQLRRGVTSVSGIGFGGQAAAAITAIGGNANMLVGGAGRFAQRNAETLRALSMAAKARDAFTNSIEGARLIILRNAGIAAQNLIATATGGRIMQSGALGRSQASAVQRLGGIAPQILADIQFDILGAFSLKQEAPELAAVIPISSFNQEARARVGSAVNSAIFEVFGRSQARLNVAGNGGFGGGPIGKRRFDVAKRAFATTSLNLMGKFLARVIRGEPITVSEADNFASNILGGNRLEAVLSTLDTTVSKEFKADNIDTRNEVLRLEGQAYFIEREEAASIA